MLNEDKVIRIFCLVDDILKKIGHKQDVRCQVSDGEVIATAVISVLYFGGHHDNARGFMQMTKLCPQMLDKSRYSRRLHRLDGLVCSIFFQIGQYLKDISMPLEVCKMSRSTRSKICKEQDDAFPNKGYCASQNLHYYGYQLHAVCSIEGVFQSIDVTPASVHDIHYLKDIQSQLSDCVLLGDKGYVSSPIQLDLFNSVNIQLETPKRLNQIDYTPQFFSFRKYRKRIETLFSQLCDQFMIRRNYAKTFHGFKTRILAKIMTVTTLQYLNKFVFNRNINNLKINLT